MQKYIEVTGKTEDEALTKGLQQLGLDRDDVSVEILERGKTGFLGIGSVPAKVKITYEAPDEPEGKEVKANELIQEEKPAPKEKAVPQPHREVPPEPKEEQPKRESASQPVPTAVVDDDVAAAIVQFQTGLFAHMGVEATPVITREGDTYQVVLEGEDLGALIGRRGRRWTPSSSSPATPSIGAGATGSASMWTPRVTAPAGRNPWSGWPARQPERWLSTAGILPWRL